MQMRLQKKHIVRYLLVVLVVVSAGAYVRHRTWLSKQERYRAFFEKRGLCFDSFATGVRKSVRWVSVIDCAEKDNYPGKEVESEVELNSSSDCSPVEIEFIDMDADGVPEVHASGYDNSTHPNGETPGNNFFRYDEKNNSLKPIPLGEVSQKWRDRYPEDTRCIGVFP